MIKDDDRFGSETPRIFYSKNGRHVLSVHGMTYKEAITIINSYYCECRKEECCAVHVMGSRYEVLVGTIRMLS